MPTDFEGMLRRYADLTIAIGLNLQPGQRLLIIGPIANGGASLEAAPLVREITASAYRAGARLVETL
jgi:aminopeptidase